MTRLLPTMLLFVVSVSAQAQQRSVQVRLFWQHPPAEIRVDPQTASLETCNTCPRTPLTVPTQITAKASTVLASSTSSAVVLLTGRFRVSGNGFPPFAVANELRVQARDDRLLLTLNMSLEEYVTAVLQGESAGFKSDEALKAMAVAARTYAVHFGSRHKLGSKAVPPRLIITAVVAERLKTQTHSNRPCMPHTSARTTTTTAFAHPMSGKPKSARSI